MLETSRVTSGLSVECFMWTSKVILKHEKMATFAIYFPSNIYAFATYISFSFYYGRRVGEKLWYVKAAVYGNIGYMISFYSMP